MDIQQGNVVTSKMLLQLRPGMTKSQVKFVMGSPLITDSFHTKRWDYFYQLRQAGKVIEQRRVILDFENELLSRVRGDVVPQGTSGDAVGLANEADANEARARNRPVEKEGVFENLKFWKSNDAQPEKAVDKPIPKKPASEDKGLLDSLKFWQKDAKPEAVKPVTPAKTEKNELQNGGTDVLPNTITNEKHPIIDAPIAVTPQEPTINTQANQQQSIELESPKIGPVKTPEPPISFIDPAATVTPADTKSTEPVSPQPALESNSAAPAPSLPATSTNKDDQQTLRLEKKLSDTPDKNVVKPTEQAEKSLEATPVQTPRAKAKPQTEPAVIEPDMFDRILEKIGF